MVFLYWRIPLCGQQRPSWEQASDLWTQGKSWVCKPHSLCLSVCQVPASPSRKNRRDHRNQWQPEGLRQHLRHLAQDHSREVIVDRWSLCKHILVLGVPLPNVILESPPRQTASWITHIQEVFTATLFRLSQVKLYLYSAKWSHDT